MIRDLCYLLETSANKYSERAAVRERAEDGTLIEYTYAHMRRDILTLSDNMRRAGFGGKRAVITGDNSYRWIVCLWAVILSGGIAVPFDRELPTEDIPAQLDACKAEAVFCSRPYLNRFEACGRSLPVFMIDAAPGLVPFSAPENGNHRPGSASVNRTGHFTASENGHKAAGDEDALREDIISTARPCPDPDSTAVILFTSGTAGARKAVRLTHRNLCSNIECVTGFDFVNGDSPEFLSVLPIFHCYELFCYTFPAFALGKTMNFPGSLKYLADDIIRLKPDVIPIVPQLLPFFYRAYTKRGVFLPCLVIGGAAPDRALIQKMLSAGFRICTGYGMTEASPLISVGDVKAGETDIGSTVLPHVRVRIDCPDADGTGEILISGPNVTPGYFEDEEADRSSFTDDGWLRTGDIGRLTDNGLRLTGRKKSTIILDNGKNVQPEELEQRAKEELPYAEELAVCEAEVRTGGTDKRVLCLLLQLPDGPAGEQPRAQTETDIKRLNSRLAAWQQIACYAISPEPLPVNALKKLSRSRLPGILSRLEKHFLI